MKKTIILLLVLMFSATLLYAGNGELIVNGMIGAGNTNPNYSVDVIGDVNVTGTYRINGVSLPSALVGAVSGLSITNDATNPNTKIDVKANVIGTVVLSGTMAIDCTTSGQPAGNDLDTGTLAAYTWYYIWAIYNGTTMAGLASTSQTSPTMPANYTNAYQRLIGVAKTDANANFLVFVQQGNHYVYDATIWGIAYGTAAQNWTVVNCSGYIPPISTRGWFQVNMQTPSVDGGVEALLRKNGSTSGGHLMGQVQNSELYSTVNDFIDTDSSQCVQFYTSAAVGWGWYLNVNGFELNL